MSVEQALQIEIDESKKWIERENDDSTYKRDLKKRIELINWILENMKKDDVQICNLIESKMNEIIQTINKTYSIFESDKLHSELRILEWIFLSRLCYQKINSDIIKSSLEFCSLSSIIG
jgi:hypothetical protein